MRCTRSPDNRCAPCRSRPAEFISCERGSIRDETMERHEVAVVVGVGPGLGYSLSRRFGRAEMQVAMAARDASRLGSLVWESSGISHQARAYGCDATDERQVEELFRRVSADLGE